MQFGCSNSVLFPALQKIRISNEEKMHAKFEFMVDITKLSVQLIRYVFKGFKYFAPFEIPFIAWARQCPNLVYIGFGNLKRIGFISPMASVDLDE